MVATYNFGSVYLQNDLTLHSVYITGQSSEKSQPLKVRSEPGPLEHKTNALPCRCTCKKRKKDSKDQESIQSSTTPVPGYQMGK